MSLPFSTAEVRWFFEGKLPPQVSAWFAQVTEKPGPLSAREDFYLCLPERDSLGIKLREGKIEVKQRFGERRAVRFADNVRGHVELWRKWSYVLAEADEALADIDKPSGAWLGVQKERQLQAYAITAQQEVFQVGPETLPKNGCELELAQVKVKGTTWWSICLEAHGEESQLSENLRSVATLLFSVEIPIALELAPSFGYAKLLQKHC